MEGTEWEIHSIEGAIAQLGERLHGMQEVGGSIPPGSTNSDPGGRRGASGRAAGDPDAAILGKA